MIGKLEEQIPMIKVMGDKTSLQFEKRIFQEINWLQGKDNLVLGRSYIIQDVVDLIRKEMNSL